MTIFIPGAQDSRGNSLIAAGGAGADAFGRMRVSDPYTIFSAKQTNGSNEPLLHTEFTAGSGTIVYQSAQSLTELKVTTASGDRAVRQSKLYCPYQPGKSQLIFASVVLGAAQANTTKRVGYYDDNNGVFFEMAGASTKQLVIRKAAADTVIATQANWNLDKLDGTGDSGLTIDLTKIQVLVIDFSWLGAGRIKFGWLIGGTLIYCHEYVASNVLTGVHLLTPNLPVRYEIVNTGTSAGAAQVNQICFSVMSEGGISPKGKLFSADSGITIKSIGTTLAPVLSIRLKSANARALAIPTSFSSLVSSATNYRYCLLLNPTLTGANFVSVNANSYMDVDVAATALSGGSQLNSGYVSQDNRTTSAEFTDFQLGIWGASYSGTPDILTLAVQVTSGAARDFLGSFNWLEVD